MRGVLTLFLLIALSGVAVADVVTFSNGDRLTGKVNTLIAGKLTFTSVHAGVITAAVGDIRSLATDAPVTIVLADNTVLTGRIHAGQAGQWSMEIGGRLRTYAFADLKAINPPAPLRVRWRGNVAANVELLSSLLNSRNISLTIGARREAATNRFLLDAAYLQSRQGRVTLEESAFLNGAYDYGVQHRFYGFVNGGLRTDRIQHLDLRTTLGAGAGYHWIKSQALNFRTEAGLSWLNESFSGAAAEGKITAQLGYIFDTLILGRARFRHNFNFYPNLGDFGDSYLLAEFALEQPLSRTFYINVRYFVDYTSKPDAGVARSTSKFIVGIGKTF